MDLNRKLKEIPLVELNALKDLLQQKSSFTDFLKFASNLVVEGRTVETNMEHYKAWDKLKDNPRLAVECARGHGKTTFWSICYPLWKMVSNPNYHICIISYSNAQSIEILRKLRLALESTPAFQDMIPQRWKPGSWGKTEVHLLNRSYINVKSFGSSIRGGHYDLIIVDDPLKDRSSMDAAQQENIFFGALSPAIKPNGQIIVVGTPVKYGDLFDILKDNKQYVHRRFPAINEDGTALWPSEFSMAVLEKKKEELNQYWFFAREYLLQRVDPDNAPFKANWFKFYTPETLPKRLSTLISVDPAITFEGDYTGIVVTGTDENNFTYVLSTRKMRTSNVNDIVSSIVGLGKQYGCRQLLIEAIGFQRLLKHWLYKEMESQGHYMGVEEIKSYTTSKTQRILALQPKIEMGKLLLMQNQTDLLEQFMTFPKANHDDLTDALSMQVGHWRKASVETAPEIQGTFNQLFNSVRKESQGPWGDLFIDLMDEPTNSNIVSRTNRPI